MSRFDKGWIKMHRDILNSDICCNPILFSLWGHLLLMATWQETKIIWEGEQKVIPPGSVISGTKELSTKLNCSRRTVQRWLTYLEKTERICLTTCPRGTLVTICNWSTYQVTEDMNELQSISKVLTSEPQDSPKIALIEEYKNIRKKEDNTIAQSSKADRASKFDFELLYKKYPRKLGKGNGIKRCKSQIKSDNEYQDLSSAIDKFCAYHKTKGTLPEYLPYFSTFMSQWRDWLQPELSISERSVFAESPEERAKREDIEKMDRDLAEHKRMWGLT